MLSTFAEIRVFCLYFVPRVNTIWTNCKQRKMTLFMIGRIDRLQKLLDLNWTAKQTLMVLG